MESKRGDGNQYLLGIDVSPHCVIVSMLDYTLLSADRLPEALKVLIRDLAHMGPQTSLSSWRAHIHDVFFGSVSNEMTDLNMLSIFKPRDKASHAVSRDDRKAIRDPSEQIDFATTTDYKALCCPSPASNPVQLPTRRVVRLTRCPSSSCMIVLASTWLILCWMPWAGMVLGMSDARRVELREEVRQVGNLSA